MEPLELFVLSDVYGGGGYIAGESPTGLVTVNSAPSSREVELRDRGTRRTVATIFSEADGTYRFENVNPAIDCDVIGRDWSGTYNDVIVSRVKPQSY